jgi:biopolymer transport protein TolR
MAIGGSNDRFLSEINVTPFVDVMLVILIMFMVTAPMMVQGVNVNLPEATADPLPSEIEHLIITIDNSGQVSIGESQVTLEFLQEKLGKILEARASRDAYLRADKDIPYGVVVRVMAEMKAAGVDRLGMITDPKLLEKNVKNNPGQKAKS